MLTSSLSKTVMYPALEKFAVLRSELDSMEGMMWTSFSGCRILCASSLWKILLDMHPVGMRGAVGVPMLGVDCSKDSTKP